MELRVLRYFLAMIDANDRKTVCGADARPCGGADGLRPEA